MTRPAPTALAPRLAAVLALLALAACGIDGPPLPPSENDLPAPGVTLSGEARIGVETTL
jgi:predicted small lipoprotein YifL